MIDGYDELGDPRVLLHPERDPVTGRLDLRRDDKRRDDQRPDRRRRPRPRSHAVITAVIVAIGLVVVAVVFAVARNADDQVVASGADAGAATEREPEEGPGESTTTTEAAATALSFAYRGGRIITSTCTTPDGASCPPIGNDWALGVRCTADGCTVDAGSGPVPFDGPTAISIQVPYDDPNCGAADVTGTLVPEGSVTTRGLQHPARITGSLRYFSTPKAVPTSDCWGAEELFDYDATPS